MVKYNYWDYIEAFNKVFLYENNRRKHFWFIKVCGEIYKRSMPTWFFQWWTNYGPSIRILPEKIKELYSKWLNFSPELIEFEENNRWIEDIGHICFFIEISIPWIWKWSPEVGYTQQKIPCLKRCFFTKYWDKLIKIDKTTGQMYGQENIFNIEEKIKKYEEQKLKRQKESPNPFQHITRRLRMQKGMISQEEIIKAYIQEMTNRTFRIS